MLNLKLVQPKPRLYKIAFASLDYKKKKKVKRSVQEHKQKDEIDIVIDMAVRKGLLEENEREIKKTELSLYSKEEVEKYKQTVAEADKIDFLDDDTPINNALPTEIDTGVAEDEISPEEMLARIKGTGGTIGDFSHVTEQMVSQDGFGDAPRSLKNVQAGRAYNREVQMALANSVDSSTEFASTEDFNTALFEKSLETLKTVKAANIDMPNEMTNFKGLTKPIVQRVSETSSNPMTELFNNMNWTIGKR